MGVQFVYGPGWLWFAEPWRDWEQFYRGWLTRRDQLRPQLGLISR